METGYVLPQHWHLKVVVVFGFFLDLLFDDSEHQFHLVRIIGGLVWELERRPYPKAGPPVAAFWNELFPWLCCVGMAGTGVFLLTVGLRGIFFLFGFLFEILLSYQPFATRCLRDSAERVVRALGEGGLAAGRKAASHIVGRDTEALDEVRVIRVTVETAAENISDGEVAPFFYLLLFGMTGGRVYKIVNTMDLMLGYKNAHYESLGRVAARMDDVFNWIPARIAVLPLIAAAAITGQDVREAARISRRDHYRRASLNSAQTESVMARALGVRLAGPVSYFGERKEKPYIGDAGREIETGDIARASRILTTASWLSLFFFLAFRFFCCVIVAKPVVNLQSATMLLSLLF